MLVRDLQPGDLIQWANGGLWLILDLSTQDGDIRIDIFDVLDSCFSSMQPFDHVLFTTNEVIESVIIFRAGRQISPAEEVIA